MSKIASFYKSFLKKASFAVLPLAVLLYNPTPAHAGILSFMSDILTGKSVEAQEIQGNSQTVALLQPNSAPDQSTKAPGEITVVDDAALSSESGPLGTEADVLDIPETDEISVHIVRKGDTITGVAKMFGVSTNTILWANNLKKGQALTEGSTLVILPISGTKHTVKKGDTLKSISALYKGEVEDIASFNGILSTDQLEVGTVIIIPDGEMATPVTPKTTVKGKTKERTFGTNGPSYAGYYMHPVPGSRRSQGLHGHNGIDMAAPIGTPVYAAASGTVIVSNVGGWGGGYGTYVVISHPNGTQTLYAHNSKNLVSVGQKVDKGEQIAKVGSTGRSTGPHVHFEVRGAKNPF